MSKVRVIAVTNQKGGVGKTTTAINLSACLAAEGKRVLAVDADQQGNTTSGLGLDKNDVPLTIYDVFFGRSHDCRGEAADLHGWLGGDSCKYQFDRSGD